MSVARAWLLLLVLLSLGLGGCGDEEAGSEPAGPADPPSAAPADPPAGAPGTEPAATPPAASPSDTAAFRRPAGEGGMRLPATAARIELRDSQFGDVLFDGNGQVVYAFEADRPRTSNCTSAECVEAWPPVLTKQAPIAGRGVRAGLLGTITRDDGSTQVTYDGRPLYFYAHEARGEVTCHTVDIHGGLWWVVRSDGSNAPA